MLKRLVFYYLIAFLSFTNILAQPVEQFIKVIVAPDHNDWTYKTGESAKFTISVLQNGNPIRDVKIKYQTGPEKLDPTTKKENVVLSKGTITIDGGTLKTAGFLRCAVETEVDGKIYKGLATAGFEPMMIKPTVANPPDFASYWDKAKTDLATIPMDTKMTLLPDRCTENVSVYHVNLQNFKTGSRLFGILCVPKKKESIPRC